MNHYVVPVHGRGYKLVRLFADGELDTVEAYALVFDLTALERGGEPPNVLTLDGSGMSLCAGYIPALMHPSGRVVDGNCIEFSTAEAFRTAHVSDEKVFRSALKNASGLSTMLFDLSYPKKEKFPLHLVKKATPLDMGGLACLMEDS